MYEWICIGGPIHFSTISNLCTICLLAAFVSGPDIDSTMTDALASVDKSMYPSVASRELTTITSDYATENIFYTNGSMIDDVACSWIRSAQQKL
jgi:hypothetical protein